MRLISTSLKDVAVLEPTVYGDERGFFLEAYNEVTFESLGLPTRFVQDNHSGSKRGVLRGLHYQLNKPQGKLVRALRGEIFDVAVDIRQNSNQFGQWIGVVLSAANRLSLWVPPGFAHGFLVMSDFAEVSYKATQLYAPAYERSVLWNDPAIGISWPLEDEPILSNKDRTATLLSSAETYDASANL